MIKLFKLKILTKKDYIKMYKSEKELREALDMALRQCSSQQDYKKHINYDYIKYKESGKKSREILYSLMNDKYYFYR